jgi:hypothetical protein
MDQRDDDGIDFARILKFYKDRVGIKFATGEGPSGESGRGYAFYESVVVKKAAIDLFPPDSLTEVPVPVVPSGSSA